MDENYMMELWRGCRHPVQQVEIIAELCGQTVEAVIEVLRRRGAIGADVTAGNYKRKLAGTVSAPISEELRRYILATDREAKTVAAELGLPKEEVTRVRRAAAEELKRKKEEAKCNKRSRKSRPFVVKLS